MVYSYDTEGEHLQCDNLNELVIEDFNCAKYD